MIELLGERYELVAAVAEGGMASVWRGFAHGAGPFRSPVAIKILKSHFRADKDLTAMFLEEARIGATLHHPHIVEAIDYFIEDETQYLVLEWVEGASVLDVWRRYLRDEQPLPWPFVAHVAIGALRGLGAAHRRTLEDGTVAPVIHRDVSPANILLGSSGAVKLADFGVARARDRVAKATQPGMVKGKLSYLAPELARGLPATPASDIFSLGTTMWELLAGRKLFEAKSDADVLRAILLNRAPLLTEDRPTLPKQLAACVARALATDVKDRYKQTREMLDDLNAVLRESGSNQDAYDCVAEVVALVKS